MGRTELVQFFHRFEPQLRARQLSLPAPDLPEPAWREALTRMLKAAEALPADVNEALFAFEEMATREGLDQLEAAAARAGLGLDFEPGSSRADVVLRTWLAHPELLARAHRQHRLSRLCAFECFGGSGAGRQELPGPFPEALGDLSAALDRWFAAHGRGQNTTRVEVHAVGNEFWFLVRHGDTFTRKPKVEAQATELLQFLPERGDVAVWCPAHDCLRINARTRGERELYVREFGRWLCGAEDYFADRDLFTLEPLRSEGAAALGTAGMEGIVRVVLREAELALDECGRRVITRAGDDLFHRGPEAGTEGGEQIEALAEGRLLRATLDFHFAGCPKPRSVQIRLPNILKLGRHCDAPTVYAWLARQGFRRAHAQTANVRGTL